MRAKAREQRGAALLIVIALTAILAAIVTAYLAAASVQSKTAANLAEAIRAEAAADGAVALARWGLEETGAALASGALACTLGEHDIEILIENEAEKLNVNFASEESLALAMTTAGFDAAEAALLAARIADYIDADGRPRTPGGEDAARNGPIDLFTELSLIDGIGEHELSRLGSVLSVYSRKANFNASSPGGRMIKLRAAALRGGRIHFVRRAVIEFDVLAGAESAVREWGRGYAAEFASFPATAVPSEDCESLFVSG